MLYVFEGPRNSGKTFLSNYISERFKIQRFQFLFAQFFKSLSLSSGSKDAHSFALGKELMIMQIFNDLILIGAEGKDLDVIHDRGILTVLAWGIMENRITEDEMEDQVKMIKEFGLMSKVEIVFITGNNHLEPQRKKDQWDHIDGDTREIEAYRKVISKFNEHGIGKIKEFKNNFDEESLILITNLFKK